MLLALAKEVSCDSYTYTDQIVVLPTFTVYKQNLYLNKYIDSGSEAPRILLVVMIFKKLKACSPSDRKNVKCCLCCSVLN